MAPLGLGTTAFPTGTTDGVKQRVSYFYQSDIGHYYYGPGHPMKPHRMKLAHHLILSYNLYRKMEVYRPHAAQFKEMQQFHSEEYLRFLEEVTHDNLKNYTTQMQQFNVGESTDCPVFDGLYEFCSANTGCSIDGALKLNQNKTDIAINWSGGLHHAKKSEASGFCYVNDIVLAILELLKYHPRVLYIDIDIQVMTLSFHKFGDFFPGTGDVNDVGTGSGKYYSINFPLQDGMDDRSYERVFKPVINKVMEVYQPTAIVMQCGADSLTQDRLGCFNLTVKGHAECVKHVRSFNVPMLVLGGGGYTVRNVARCWAYETSVLLDVPVPDDIPFNDYFDYYAPDYKLHLTPSTMDNANTRESLEKTKAQVLEHLSYLQGAPSVGMHEVPPDTVLGPEPDEDAADPDVRQPAMTKDGALRRSADNEWFEDDRDQDH